MADVGKVPGTGGPQDASRGRPATHAQKFKEMMKVQKVDEVDEEKTKKRKRPEETEADTATEAEEAIARPSQKKEPSPFEVTTKVKKEASEQATEAETAPPAEIDSDWMEEDEYMQALSTEKKEEKPAALKREKGEAPAPAIQPRKPRPHEKKIEAAGAKGITEYVEAEQRHVERAKTEIAGAEKEMLAIRQEEKKIVSKAEKAKAEKKEKVEEQAEAALPSSAQLAPFETKKAEEKKKKVEEAGEKPVLPTPAAEMVQVIPPAEIQGSAPASYAYLHPAVHELFERMVGVMTVMSATGVTETTLTLTAPEYANSAFYGAQVIIKEYATAPKAFNVQIVANEQAVALAQSNMGDLMRAFQTGNYNFKINRLEAVLSTERPIFRRKEKIGEEESEQNR